MCVIEFPSSGVSVYDFTFAAAAAMAVLRAQSTHHSHNSRQENASNIAGPKTSIWTLAARIRLFFKAGTRPQ